MDYKTNFPGEAASNPFRIKTSRRLSRLLVVLVTPAALLFASPASGRDDVELDEAEVFIEWNSTDTDFGIQVFWDSVGFTKMQVYNNSGKEVLNVETKKNLKTQGLTEGFFESVEPPATELSMEQFLTRFPEGEYEFRGTTPDGNWLVGEAEFTHILPAPPANLSPREGDVVSHLGFMASFDAVTEDWNGFPLDIELYEIVVEKEDDDPILQTYKVILSGDVASPSVFVPGGFLEPNTEYKLEVIAQEESGNRTITEEAGFATDGL